MENAKLVESILFSYDDTKLRWIAYDNWTYALSFSMKKEDFNHDFVVLTFNGLDTLATVKLNGVELGETNNMFVRFRFDVKEVLVEVRKVSPFEAKNQYFSSCRVPTNSPCTLRRQ